MLQNFWLCECERLHDKKYWSKNNLWNNLNRLINSLLKCLKRGTVTMYFEKEINLLKSVAMKDLQQTIRHIEDFQQNVNDKLIHALKTGKRNVIT